MLSSLRIPCSDQGSFFIFSLTSFSSSALKIKREPPSSTKGPPIKIKPSATSRSINSACSSQKGCSRVAFDKSRLGPAEEITANVFFIRGKSQASVHRVQPGSSRLIRSTASANAGSLCSQFFCAFPGANRIDNAKSFRLKRLLYANPAHIHWNSISHADSRLCVSCDPFPSVGH